MAAVGESGDVLAREIVAAVGLLEEWAHLDIVAAVVDERIELVVEAVAGLEAAGVIRGASPLRLSQMLTPGARGSELPDSRRAVLSSRIAEALRLRGAPDSVVCSYLLVAPGTANTNHVGALRRHARAVARVGQHREASMLLRRALREPPPPGSVAAVLVELADELTADGSHTEGLEIARQIRDSTAEEELRLTAVQCMFRALYGAGRVEEAIRLISLEVQQLPGEHDASALALEHELVRHAGSDVRVLEASLARFSPQRVDDALPEAAAYLLAMSQILGMGNRASATEAVDLVERSIALGVLEGDDTDAAVRSLWLLIRADAYEAANRILRAHRAAMAPELGAPDLDAFEGLATLRAGSVTDAVDLLTRAHTDARRHANSFAEAASLGFLAHALYEADETTRLTQLLGAVDLDCSMRNAWTAILRVARGRHLLDQGRADDALADFVAVDREKGRLGLTNPAGFDQAEYAVEALLRLGRPSEALALAERNLSQALRWGAPETLARGHRAIASCSPPDRAPAHLRAGACCLGEDRRRLVGAQLALDLGEALVTANRRKEAEAHLCDALDIATRIGARRIARHANLTLATIGRRVRRPHAHGVEALTPAELRIVRLAADRHSNKVIAATLHLSVRTVENTLRHAYQKLETDRAGLARLTL